ncbi:hypothetical protein JCM24511_02129 [Saitozyma sp. JCM 24511]|nr:hypothetical protein JCM24511_02129 [Saitozyma sp. JCM 24511]
MFAALTVGNVYLAAEAPYYHTGLYVDIGCWSVLFILVVSMGQYLRYLNRKQETRRVALGLPANIKDMSIMSTEESNAYKAELAEAMRQKGLSMEAFNDNAFDDMTDFEWVRSLSSPEYMMTFRAVHRNPNFMYVM